MILGFTPLLFVQVVLAFQFTRVKLKSIKTVSVIHFSKEDLAYDTDIVLLSKRVVVSHSEPSDR